MVLHLYRTTEPILAPQLVHFINNVSHTKRRANELFASMCCLHYWTVQRQTQRPPLKGRDSQDKPSYCIPRSLVPQHCRISTHTSGVVLRLGTGGVMWKRLGHCGWLAGWIDACRFLTSWQTASSARLWVRM